MIREIDAKILPHVALEVTVLHMMNMVQKVIGENVSLYGSFAWNKLFLPVPYKGEWGGDCDKGLHEYGGASLLDI